MERCFICDKHADLDRQAPGGAVVADEPRRHVPELGEYLHLVSRYPGTPREYWWTRVDEWPGAPRGDAESVAAFVAKLRRDLT